MSDHNAYIIIGGTFDPVHNGHIQLANALYKRFKQEIVFVPTAAPNYKSRPSTTAKQRLDMLKLALKDNSHFIIDSCEIFQSDYIPTVKSLQMLRKKIGRTMPIYFLIGEDSLLSLDTWDNWRSLFDLTNFIIAMRPGYKLEQMSYSLKEEYNKRITESEADLMTSHGQIYILDFAPVDISSTQIRSNIINGLPIDKMVDPGVAKYISENKLYFNNKSLLKS